MPPLAPISTDPSYRHNPYQQFTGFESLPQMGGPMGQMLMQYFGSQFMAGADMIPMGLSEQNVYDRLQAVRLQKMHDEFLAQATKNDQETYFQALRGFSQMMGSPWERPQIEAAEHLSGMMSEFAPQFLPYLPPDLIDSLGGMRGMNVVMAEHMFQGGRFRIDPTTGQAGMSNEALTQLNDQIYNTMFSGSNWRRGTGMSAGETGQLFHELSRVGMMGGGTQMEDLVMQIEGTPAGPGMPTLSSRGRNAIFDRATEMGLDLGMGPGYDPRLAGETPRLNLKNVTPEQLEGLREDPEVSAALASFDSSRAISTLQSYSGVLKAMREIFGDAGKPNAPIPELINALNQLTGGSLPQLAASEVENMVRVTTNLAHNTGLGLEATMMLSQAAVEQAQSMGLPPIFASDALQHSLAFRGAFQNENMGQFPSWGASGQEANMMKDMQLTAAAAGSRLANQMGTALRIEDALSPGDRAAFRPDSAAANYLEAVRLGATEFNDTRIDPATGRPRGDQSLRMRQDDFSRMLVEGAQFDLNESTVQRFLGQSDQNLEQVRQYNVPDTVRRLQRGEFIEMLVGETEYNAQERIGGLGLEGVDIRAEQGLGHAVSSAAMNQMFNLTKAQRADQSTRNQLMASAIEDQLQQAAQGDLVIRNRQGVQVVTREQAGSLLGRFREDENFRESLTEELFGAADRASRDPFSDFGSMSIQDAMTQMDTRVLNRTARNQARADAEAMTQKALAPLGRSGALRHSVQAIIDADPDDTLRDILAKTLGGERSKDIARAMEDSGVRTRLIEAAKDFERDSATYEAADSAEDRAAALGPLRASQRGYQDVIGEIANTARRAGYQLGGLVDRSDASRMVLASDYVRSLQKEGKDTGEVWSSAVRLERQRQDDFVALAYSDPRTMSRLGQRGLTQLKAMTDAQADLDAMATLEFGGDMGALRRDEKPEGMAEEDWQRIRKRRDIALDAIKKSQGFFRDAIPGTAEDYGYLGDTKSLTATMRKIATGEGSKASYGYLGDLGQLMELEEGDLRALSDPEREGGAIISEAEAEQIREAQGKYTAFQEKMDRQKSDYRKSGDTILREGMARMRLGPDATEEEIEKRAKDLTEDQLRGYYGREDYAELKRKLSDRSDEGIQRKHAFAELFRDRDEMRKRGGGFDPQEGGGDLLDMYDKLPTDPGLKEGEQEKQEVKFVMETGVVRIEMEEDGEHGRVRVEGPATVDEGRQ